MFYVRCTVSYPTGSHVEASFDYGDGNTETIEITYGKLKLINLMYKYNTVDKILGTTVLV